MDVAALRAEFPVLERLAYLNAGTNGPIPARAGAAAQAELQWQLESGREGKEFFRGRLLPLAARLRERVAALIGCGPADLALTGSTTDGVNTVVSGLDLESGDEVLTSDEEHPGLLAPLALGAARRGFTVRRVPFAELPGEVGPLTRLVACSHVSWVGGQVIDSAALADSGVPVLLDGAQGLGAVPVDVEALGCDFYAASGQKWLCGPVGLGYLYVRPERLGDLSPPWPGFGTLASPEDPLVSDLKPGAERLDPALAPSEHTAWALAAIALLDEVGMEQVLRAGPAGADRLAGALADAGREVAPRGRSTLASWKAEDPEAEVGRLREEGFVLRFLPGRGLVRASVGAWNSEDEIERLVAATSRS